MRKIYLFIAIALLASINLCGLSRADSQCGPPFFNGKIMPSPQQVQYMNEFVTVYKAGEEASTCILVADGEARSCSYVKDLLSRIESFGGKAEVVTDKKAALRFKLIISIGKNDLTKKYIARYELKIPSQEEGYIIYPLKDAGREIVLCAGKDERGTVWSIQSLIQLFKREDDRVLLMKAKVIDYPYIKWRMAFGGSKAYKYNISGWVISKLGCKGNNWRDIFSSREWETEITNKIEDIRQNKLVPLVPINVIGGSDFAFYPTFSDPGDMKILREAAGKVARAGGAVVLMFDDTGHMLTAKDKAYFGTLEKTHVYVVNEVYSEMKRANPSALLIFCPPLYFGAAIGAYPDVDGPAYVQALSNLPQDIQIHWSGGDPAGRYISRELISEWQQYYSRKLFFFDNDWQWRRFGSKDFPTTHPDIYKHIDGYLMSGSGDIGMIVLADYLWNPEAYNADRSFRSAVEQLAGRDIYPVFRRWREVIDRSEEAGRIPESGPVMKKHVENLISLSKEIESSCANKSFVSLIKNETGKWVKLVNNTGKQPEVVQPETLVLENDLIKLVIVPAEGGRIDEFIDKKRGRNLFYSYYTSEKGEKSRIGRAYMEFPTADSPRRLTNLDNVPFEVIAHEEGNVPRVELTAIIRQRENTGYSVSRMISLKDNSIEISTELKNIGLNKEAFRLRVHPEFALPFVPSLHRYYLYVLRDDDKLKRIMIDPSPGGLTYVGKDLPKGMWGIGDVQENWGLFNYFNKDEIAQCYLFADWMPELRNLELWGRLKELEPGRSLRVAHKYCLVNNLDEFLKNYSK